MLALVGALAVVFVLAKCLLVVPEHRAFLVERLGQYHRTLDTGFHVLVPWMDVVRHRVSLKESAVDMPEQICITRDKLQVRLDGVLYLKVVDPENAAYNVADYELATTLLAQTVLRSEVSRLELDDLFEARTGIKRRVREEVEESAKLWGVRVLRYEIKSILPPADVVTAVTAAEGSKQQVIKASEAKRQQQINDAQGAAEAILALSTATAEGIRAIGAAIREPGGLEAMQLRVAEQYVSRLAELSKQSTTLLMPGAPNELNSLLSSAMNLKPNITANGREENGTPHTPGA